MSLIRRFAHSVVLAWGWRRAVIAFCAGAISTLALAPFDIWPVLFVTFPVLVWLIDGSAAGKLRGVPAAMVAGWFFGFGYFFAGLYWIGNAFLVDAKIFGWLLPFAITAMPAGLALFTAAGAGLARLLWRRGPLRIIALAVALTASEWLRGHVLTGFPWNAFGYTLTGPLVLAQSAALIGLWGLTFLAVAIFSSTATLADEQPDTRRPWLPLTLSAIALLAMAGYGAMRLQQAPSEFADGVRLRIMQPNLQQDQKFNYAARKDVMARYLALSERATGPQSSGMRDVTHLIWPESAFPFLLTREAEAMAQIAELLPQGSVLITGAARAAEDQPAGRPLRAYNSIYVIDHDGTILSIYDKVHLVPFGEYLPFQAALEKLGLMQLTKLPGGFLAGDRRRTYAVPRAPRMLPLICYEIIFPGDVAPIVPDTPNVPDTIGGTGARAGWMLNVTNDAWFGISPGPYQHFQQARIRAIEEGLPLVRAANTGISAVTDSFGRIIKSLPLGVEGVLDSPLPRQIASPFIAKVGDGLIALVLAAATIILLTRRGTR